MSAPHDSNDFVSTAAPKSSASAEAAPAPALPKSDANSSEPRAALLGLDPPPSGAPQTVRVAVAELDALVDLVGELVLARNQLLQTSLASRDNAATAITQRLDVVTSDLQEGLMRMRMQPVGAAWGAISELARECAAKAGKRVALRLEGFEIELDRTALEGLREPLGELVRLVVEHSIESANERERAGKPREALLELAASHEGGRVVLELTDDGAGLDQDSPAVRESLARVRSEFARLGANLATSRSGERNVSRLAIPLTLAITPALLVSAGAERFALPQTSLVELVRIARGDSAQVESFAGGSVFRLREELLPVVDLRGALGLSSEGLEERETSGLVVLQAGAQRYGLVVDKIHDTEEIVVKGLAPALAALGLYSGATVLGDGGVALILDVPGLARSAGLEVSELGLARSERGAPTLDANASERERWLVFELRGGRRMAAPLDKVSRLEEFPLESLERSCDARVVQYRGTILPLIETADLLGLPPAPTSAERDFASVVVLAIDGRLLGMVAERIVDILDCEPQARRDAPREGIASTVVLGSSVTDIIDVAWIAARAGLGGDAQTIGADSEAEDSQTVRQLCTFHVGELALAADVESVQEILRTPPLTNVPRAAPGADALINLRGQTVLTLDLAQRLSAAREEAQGAESGAMTVVFRTRQGPLAARVDSVGDVLEIDPELLAPAPRHGNRAVLTAVRELYTLPDSLVLVLDVERLLGDATALERRA